MPVQRSRGDLEPTGVVPCWTFHIVQAVHPALALMNPMDPSSRSLFPALIDASYPLDWMQPDAHITRAAENKARVMKEAGAGGEEQCVARCRFRNVPPTQ